MRSVQHFETAEIHPNEPVPEWYMTERSAAEYEAQIEAMYREIRRMSRRRNTGYENDIFTPLPQRRKGGTKWDSNVLSPAGLGLTWEIPGDGAIDL